MLCKVKMIDETAPDALSAYFFKINCRNPLG